MNQPVLLIIDMQIGMSWPSVGERNNPQAEARIAELLSAWRDSGAPIVHVRHISRTPASVFFPGQEGAAFQPAFVPRAGEHVVEKNVPDAFIQGGLERWLHVRGIASVVVVGVSTNNSVESTARTAGNLGFKTYVVSDATFAFAQADFNGVHRTADEVHAMSLANLRADYAEIVDTVSALSLIARPTQG